eukprot:c23917_g1_i1 orf=472-1038(-)
MDRQGFRRIAIKAWQPKWKKKLRDQCLQRVKQDRDELIWRIRSVSKSAQDPKEVAASTFGEILFDEVNKLIPANLQGQGFDSRLWEYEPSEVFPDLSQEDYENLMTDMEKILHEDYLVEERGREAALLEEYENTCIQEEQSFTALLEHLQNEDDGLLCPICRMRYLQQKQHYIYCSCGKFQLDTQNDQ